MAYFPEGAYGDLPERQQNVFWEVSGTEHIPAGDMSEVQERWAMGFGFHAAEYDQMGITADTVHEQREWFLNYMGLEWDSFPWDDWREAMGYE
jgi:hypothetical protein